MVSTRIHLFAGSRLGGVPKRALLLMFVVDGRLPVFVHFGVVQLVFVEVGE